MQQLATSRYEIDRSGVWPVSGFFLEKCEALDQEFK